VIESIIMDQLARAVQDDPGWLVVSSYFSGDYKSSGIHLAVMAEPYLTYILNGRKTIESRFSKNLIAPYRQISPDDLVLLKAGPVVGAFRASSVECFDLDRGVKSRLRTEYSEAICADDDFWCERDDKNYATLISIAEVHVLPPLPVTKRDRRGWLVLRHSRTVQVSEQLSLL
jgi:hypothetical protein